MTASASAGEASASRLVTRPVAGSNTSDVRVLSPANGAPAFQCGTVSSSPGAAVESALGSASGSVMVVIVCVFLPGSAPINFDRADEVVDFCHCCHIWRKL